jgi:chromosome segregation ATPase
MADVLSHDRQSREAAREAIRRHNDHIEKCNRVIEAQEAGLSLSTSPAGSDVEALRAELQQTGVDLSTVKRERDQLRAELDQTRLSVADLSLRVESLARKGNGHSTDAESAAEVTTTNNADLVRHINNLQQQLHAEREKNKRLKGG